VGVQNVFVTNLPFDSTEQELTDIAQQFGDVLTVTICHDRNTGRARGFGFVEVRGDAQPMIEGLNGFFMGRRVLRAELAKPKGERRAPRDHGAERTIYE
jgi:RNA recognition motif-containing protein